MPGAGAPRSVPEDGRCQSVFGVSVLCERCAPIDKSGFQGDVERRGRSRTKRFGFARSHIAQLEPSLAKERIEVQQVEGIGAHGGRRVATDLQVLEEPIRRLDHRAFAGQSVTTPAAHYRSSHGNSSRTRVSDLLDHRWRIVVVMSVRAGQRIGVSA